MVGYTLGKLSSHLRAEKYTLIFTQGQFGITKLSSSIYLWTVGVSQSGSTQTQGEGANSTQTRALTPGMQTLQAFVLTTAPAH